MSVSETVRVLAEAISAGPDALSAHDRLLLELLKLMPLYCENRTLDAWEAAYQSTYIPDDGNASKTAHLADQVFEFGCFNMYAAFDPKGTKTCYSELSKLLEKSGIRCPIINDFVGF
jgi:hypothetical protein